MSGQPEPTGERLQAGARALAAGDWAAARAAFQTALDGGDQPEALAGLAEALWWLGEGPAAVAHWERAYAGFRRRLEPTDLAGRAAVADPAASAAAGDQAGASDAAAAVRLAVRLAIEYQANRGNHAASAGWLGRARRLVEERDLAPVAGWVRLLEAYDATDPKEAETLARQAYEAACVHNDPDLELCALSQVGAALVGQGRVSEGLRYLDEAMAGSLAGEGDPGTVVYTSCNTIMSGSTCAEFTRVVEWIRAADRFTDRYGCPYLYAYCRVRYGAVLVAVGDWTQAEEELTTAITATRDALPALHGGALAAYAELRFCQGRWEEAERLLHGLADHPAAAVPIVRLRLAGGMPAAAAAVARRQLAAIGEEQLAGMALAELLGEALIAQDEPAAALARGQQLTELGHTQGCEVAVARGERLCGRAHAATAATDPAHTHLDAAVAAFARLGMPYEAGRTRLLLAAALQPSAREAARAEAQAAFTGLDALGARRDADAAAALLRQLGSVVARVGPRDPAVLTRREREVLALLGEGLSNPQIAQRLYLSRKTVEHHVARVLAKLGLRSRAEAAAEAVRGHLSR